MIQIQVYLDYREINKLITGLFILRQSMVGLQHNLAIDNTNRVNREIIREVYILDKLISKMEKNLEQIDGNEIHFPEDGH